jgi:hypothetical protein
LTDPSAFDDHLRAALDAATPPAPDADGMRTTIEQRVMLRRRRRVAVTTALLVAVAAATAVGVAALRREPATTAHVQVGPSRPLATTVPSRPAPTFGNPAAGARAVAPGGVVSLDRLGAFEMLTPKQGIAMTGPSGGPHDNQAQAIQLAVTTDGGATWRAEGRPLPHISKIVDTQMFGRPGQGLLAFINTRVGYALTDQLYMTRNGGMTWTVVPPERVGGRDVEGSTTIASVTAANGHVWVTSFTCGSARRACTTLAVTGIGSKTWTIDHIPTADAQLDIDPSAGTVIAADLFSQSEGLPAPAAISRNHGRTWARIQLPCSDGQFVAANTHTWFSACHLSGRSHPRHADVYRSTDGGAHWQRWASFTQSYGDMAEGPVWTTLAAAADGSHLWLTSANFDNGLADLSAGTTTLQTPISVNNTIIGLDVLDAGHAWLLVPDQGLWTTDDSGTTWTETTTTSRP